MCIVHVQWGLLICVVYQSVTWCFLYQSHNSKYVCKSHDTYLNLTTRSHQVIQRPFLILYNSDRDPLPRWVLNLSTCRISLTKPNNDLKLGVFRSGFNSNWTINVFFSIIGFGLVPENVMNNFRSIKTVSLCQKYIAGSKT